MDLSLTKKIPDSGFPEPMTETEYLCRGCAGTDFIVETYFVLEKYNHAKKRYAAGNDPIMSGALICKDCGRANRIDIGRSIKIKK